MNWLPGLAGRTRILEGPAVAEVSRRGAKKKTVLFSRAVLGRDDDRLESIRFLLEPGTTDDVYRRTKQLNQEWGIADPIPLEEWYTRAIRGRDPKGTFYAQGSNTNLPQPRGIEVRANFGSDQQPWYPLTGMAFGKQADSRWGFDQRQHSTKPNWRPAKRFQSDFRGSFPPVRLGHVQIQNCRFQQVQKRSSRTFLIQQKTPPNRLFGRVYDLTERTGFESWPFHNLLSFEDLSRNSFTGRSLGSCSYQPSDAVERSYGQRKTSQKRANIGSGLEVEHSILAAAAAIAVASRRKKRGAIYARYSSRFQKSIEDQIRRCREWCQTNGVTVEEDMVFTDRAQTGKKAGRPGFRALQAAIQNRSIDVVVTFSTNRMHRKIHLALAFVEEHIVEKKLRTVFVNQGIDTDNTGLWKALMMVFSMMDELQITSAINHIRAGHEGLLLKGRVHNTLAWAYKGVEIAGEFTRFKKPSAVITVDEDLRPWVRRIFTWFTDEKVNFKRIARLLRDAKVPPPPKAHKWSRNAVRYLLQNRRYVGDWSYGRRETIWYSSLDSARQELREKPLLDYYDEKLRVVDDALFERAQLAIESLKLGKGGGRWRKNKNGEDVIDVLHEILWCGTHQRHLRPGGANGKSWVCPDCRREGNEEERSLFSHVNRELAAPLVIEALAGALLMSKEAIAEITAAARFHIEDMMTSPVADTTAIAKRIGKLESDIRFIFDNLGDTEDERRSAKDQIDEKRKVVRNLKEELAQIEASKMAPAELPTEESVARAAADLRALLLAAADSDDALARRKANAAIKLLVNGRIQMEQVGLRAAKQGHLRGTFIPSVALAVCDVNGISGLPSVPAKAVTIDFVAPLKLREDGERVMTMLEANPKMTLKSIGKELGLSPSRVWLARKYWYDQRGLDMPDLKCRGQAIKNELSQPVYIEVSELAAKLYQKRMPLGKIAEQVGCDRATLDRALRYWHQQRDLPYVDGRARRKALNAG